MRIWLICFVIFGGREGIRTPGLLVANEALSQLSYSPAVRLLLNDYTSTTYQLQLRGRKGLTSVHFSQLCDHLLTIIARKITVATSRFEIGVSHPFLDEITWYVILLENP
jgi:hypothetical protein